MITLSGVWRSIWLYRAVTALACVAGFAFLGLNKPVVATGLMLGGLLVGLTGAFMIAYVEQGKRGIAAVALGGLADFFGNFLHF